MIGTLLVEILILWALFALFMAWVVHGKGPLGGIFYYPKEVQATGTEAWADRGKDIELLAKYG